jgi:hypothetical protein
VRPPGIKIHLGVLRSAHAVRLTAYQATGVSQPSQVAETPLLSRFAGTSISASSEPWLRRFSKFQNNLWPLGAFSAKMAAFVSTDPPRCDIFAERPGFCNFFGSNPLKTLNPTKEKFGGACGPQAVN